MSDQLLAILIPAITAVLVALIGAVVTVSGRNRELAVMQALQERAEETHRLEDQIRRLTAEQEPPRAPKPRRRHGSQQ